MSRHRPDALLRQLQEGRRGGIFFLHGAEEFLKEEAVSAIVAAHVDPATRDFNLDQLRGSEVSPESFASVLQTPPMMSEWRVVVLREAQALAVSARLRSAVESVLERPVQGLALVLTAQIPDRSRAKLYERLKRQAYSVEFGLLSPEDVPGLLMERAVSRGAEIEHSAALALAAAVGNELGVLIAELDKLIDYVGERPRISTADVEAAVGRVPRVNRWDWIDQVAERRFTEARSDAAVLLDGAESGVSLVMGLGTHFLRLGLAKFGGAHVLESELPPHQRWLAGKLLRQSRNWPGSAVDSALDDLLRADRLLKSGLGDREVTEELMLRLQARAARAVPA